MCILPSKSIRSNQNVIVTKSNTLQFNPNPNQTIFAITLLKLYQICKSHSKQ